jgi:hypothetical protein
MQPETVLQQQQKIGDDRCVSDLAGSIFWFTLLGLGALQSFGLVSALLDTGLFGVLRLGILIFSIGALLGGCFFALIRIVLRDKAKSEANINFTWPTPALTVQLQNIFTGAAQCCPGGLLRPPRFSC